MGIVRGICISAVRGTKKTPVAQARLVENWGIEGDAHAGKWHRQVSLLSLERIREFQARGVSVEPGDFGENLIVEGYDLKRLPVGTRLRTRGGCLLEVTDRQGVPFPLPDIPHCGGLHYAPGGDLCPGDPGRPAAKRRYHCAGEGRWGI